MREPLEEAFLLMLRLLVLQRMKSGSVVDVYLTWRSKRTQMYGKKQEILIVKWRRDVRVNCLWHQQTPTLVLPVPLATVPLGGADMAQQDLFEPELLL